MQFRDNNSNKNRRFPPSHPSLRKYFCCLKISSLNISLISILLASQKTDYGHRVFNLTSNSENLKVTTNCRKQYFYYLKPRSFGLRNTFGSPCNLPPAVFLQLLHISLIFFYPRSTTSIHIHIQDLQITASHKAGGS